MFFKRKSKKPNVEVYKGRTKVTAKKLIEGKDIEVDKIACCPSCKHRFIVTILIKNNLYSK